MIKTTTSSLEIKEKIIPEGDNIFKISFIDVASTDILHDLFQQKNINGAFCCICQRGSLDIMISSRIHKIKTDDMFVVFPFSIFQLLHYSDDLQLYIMGVQTDFIVNIDLDSVIPLFLSVRDNPCISLSFEDKTMLIELCTQLINKSKREDNPYTKEITESLLFVLLYETIAIFTKHKPVEQVATTRNDEILVKFLCLINVNCIKERGLKFYASEMYLTPKYLAFAVKEASGRNATEWISEAVIVNIKSLLKSSDMSVGQISDFLNFPNQSFFCQYFKKHVGVTPKYYLSNM